MKLFFSFVFADSAVSPDNPLMTFAGIVVTDGTLGTVFLMIKDLYNNPTASCLSSRLVLI